MIRRVENKKVKIKVYSSFFQLHRLPEGFNFRPAIGAGWTGRASSNLAVRLIPHLPPHWGQLRPRSRLLLITPNLANQVIRRNGIESPGETDQSRSMAMIHSGLAWLVFCTFIVCALMSSKKRAIQG